MDEGAKPRPTGELAGLSALEWAAVCSTLVAALTDLVAALRTAHGPEAPGRLAALQALIATDTKNAQFGGMPMEREKRVIDSALAMLDGAFRAGEDGEAAPVPE